MPGIHVSFEVSPEKFLSDLTEAAYALALKRGFRTSFVDIELDLQAALRSVIEKDMMASPACGGPACRIQAHFEITSPTGEAICKEEF